MAFKMNPKSPALLSVLASNKSQPVDVSELAKGITNVASKSKPAKQETKSKPKEGSEKKRSTASDVGHGILDAVGLIPGVGEVADGINAGWYAAQGDKTNAGLSAASMIPFLGWGATAAKVGKRLKGSKLFKKSVKEIDPNIRADSFGGSTSVGSRKNYNNRGSN